MAESTKFNNSLSIENNRFKNKCKSMKKCIKHSIYQNAATCDEISQTQEKLLIVREQCKFLMKKLKPFEPKFGTPVVEQKVDTNNIVKKSTPRKKFNTNGVSKLKCPAPKSKQSLVEIQQPVVCGNVTIFSFGQIVYDTPFYYTDCAIYPGGFYATRTYAHFRNIFSKCTYHCRVIKAGSTPRFEIMDNDKLFKVTGLSTDECHSHLLSLINKMLGAENLIPPNRNGDRFFGLTLPIVRLRLESKPESKYCIGYARLKSQFGNYESELKAESDPSVNFEGLHRCLNKFRSRR